MIKFQEKDGHVHSPFCPHRYTDDPIADYVAAAEAAGLKEITFAEHMPTVCEGFPTPLPINFKNPDMECIRTYFEEMRRFRSSYKGSVKINIGLEVDYMEGFEEETRDMLERLGPQIEEGILSAHYLRFNGQYYYISNKDYVDTAAEEAGGAEKLNGIYYETIAKSMDAPLGRYKPKRLGHCTMIRLARSKYAGLENNPAILDALARKMKDGGYSIDLNMQGMRNETCMELFGEPMLPYAKKYGIPAAPGSDSHRANTVGAGFDHPAIANNISWLRPDWN